MKRKLSVHALAVPCPECKAGVGQHCAYLYGQFAPHRARLEAARKRAKEIIKERIEQEQHPPADK